MRHFRELALIVFGVAAGGLLCMTPSAAEDCARNPDALGTSRELVLDPGEQSRVGIMQYPDSLPLRDKEVVLTFDDGPLPPYSNQVLDILASQCVKVTYFLVGKMAREFSATARRMYEAGHTIGTHSEDHPSRFHKLTAEKAQWEIDTGIASVSAALGDPKRVAPFFRIPGLARTDHIDKELAARSLVVFSADMVADDWFHRIKASEIVRRAIDRLEARGKGILLLHDIHPVTVAALPELLRQLKERGFHVVHVVPASATRIETAAVPTALTVALASPWTDDGTDPVWPDVAVGETPNRIQLPAPDASAFASGFQVMLADGSEGTGILASRAAIQWPDAPTFAMQSPKAELPALNTHDVATSLGGCVQRRGSTHCDRTSRRQASARQASARQGSLRPASQRAASQATASHRQAVPRQLRPRLAVNHAGADWKWRDNRVVVHAAVARDARCALPFCRRN